MQLTGTSARSILKTIMMNRLWHQNKIEAKAAAVYKSRIDTISEKKAEEILTTIGYKKINQYQVWKLEEILNNH